MPINIYITAYTYSLSPKVRGKGGVKINVMSNHKTLKIKSWKKKKKEVEL